MITFILSDAFDYEDYLLDDAGPRFAAMYGWRTERLSNCSFQPHQIYVVDWYLSDAEFATIQSQALKHPSAIFSIHVVDPWPHIRGTAAYRYLTQHHSSPNALLSGPYVPTENIAHIYARNPRFVFTPYLYEPERERNIDHLRRKSTILLSGNIGFPDYPVRHAISVNSKINPLFWGSIERLKHSGYSMGNLQHAAVREQYIDQLASHKFAVVCSSRLRLEFLKYRELAYAGCVPVGDLPGTLMDCPAEAFVVWRRNFMLTLAAIRNSETERQAHAFRTFMSKTRDRGHWRSRVSKQFHEHLPSLSSRNGASE
ncbi:MAG: hypothetical protein QM773_01215 [Hyphomonadaceae bacterium]